MILFDLICVAFCSFTSCYDDVDATGVLNALIKVEAEHFPAVMAEFLQKGGQEFTPGDAMRLE